MAAPREEITRLVQSWSAGEEGALDELIEAVYDDLRRIAHHHLRLSRGDGTVHTTALVHEAYVKLAGANDGVWESRAQFFAFCSKAMRRILIDFARRRSSAKRGGGLVRVALSDDAAVVEAQVVELLTIDEVLQQLEARNARMARIAECRFFGGMSVPETAEALGTSARTVEREWARARAYLIQALA